MTIVDVSLVEVGMTESTRAIDEGHLQITPPLAA